MDQYASIVASDTIPDKIHPTLAEYTIFVDVWALAVQQVNSLGRINGPVPGTGGPLTKQKRNGICFRNLFGSLANNAVLGMHFCPESL